jgi:hypothetical protein
MPTDQQPASPSFHSGFFIEHDHPGAPAEGLTVIERDRNGVPCFACYFEALFDAVPVEHFDLSQVDTSELSPQVTAYVVRNGVAFGYLADAIAYVIARSMHHPDAIVPIFADRLSKSLADARAELDGLGIEAHV